MTTATKTEATLTQAFCSHSPTGAHHWVIGTPGAEMHGECKHCGSARAFRPFQEDAAFNNSNSAKRDSSRMAPDAESAA
ncbi:MAG: hypothetical protein WD533_06630 [Dehalococcoidia bacterium]